MTGVASGLIEHVWVVTVVADEKHHLGSLTRATNTVRLIGLASPPPPNPSMQTAGSECSFTVQPADL
jgi:hypothetical protein